MDDDFNVSLGILANREYKRLKARDLAAQHLAEEKRAAVNARDRNHDGVAFFSDLPDEPPALWGDGSQILWADGEPLVIVGDDGTGKTTVAHQLMAARLGLFSRLLNHDVTPTDGRILYLAMDRPQQARRAGARIFPKLDPTVLREQLAVWEGPLPVDVVGNSANLANWIAQEFGTDITEVYADSYKDLAAKISEDGVGAGVNSAIQEVITRGINWVGLHHPKKAQADNKTPNTLADVYGSKWLVSGHGSVLMLFRPPGQTDIDVVEVRQLKEPMNKMAPVLVKHDRATGLTSFVGPQVQSGDSVWDKIRIYLTAMGERGAPTDDIKAVVGGNTQKITNELRDRTVSNDLVKYQIGKPTWYWLQGNEPTTPPTVWPL